jgi:RNA polymerase sigma-70 factor (sigma-E family)
MHTVVGSQAAEAVMDSPSTAPDLASTTVGFLSAPLDDSFVDPVADSAPDEATGSAAASDDADGLGGVAVLDASASLDASAALDASSSLDASAALGGIKDGAAGLNGSAIRDSAAIRDGAAPLDGAAPGGGAISGGPVVNGAALDSSAVRGDAALSGLDVPDEAAAIEGDSLLVDDTVSHGAAAAEVTARAETDAQLTATPDTDATPDSGIDSGNIGVDGEPTGPVARPTDVTETLEAIAVLPEVVLAPEEAFTSQARSASAAWEASEVVTEIYTGHYSQLVRLAVLLVHDVQTAEEVVQDAFEAMHLAWRRLRDSEKALSYLRQTVVNKSRSVLRHRKVVDMHAPKPAPDEQSAEHAALALIERSAVATALRTLPVRQREAVVLRYYADFSEADIAQAMGISRGAVKSHTARAMAALKSILEQETS